MEQQPSPMSFRSFVEYLVDLVNDNPDFSDAPAMVAGDGTFAMASQDCVSLKDVPEQRQSIRTSWNPATNSWNTKEQVIPAHKVVVFSAPSQASVI